MIGDRDGVHTNVDDHWHPDADCAQCEECAHWACDHKDAGMGECDHLSCDCDQFTTADDVVRWRGYPERTS